MSKEPKLRTVNKSVPPFNLNKFPKDFPYKIGEQLVYILATRGATDIEGKEWEQIFANAVGAIWKPSNVGLDDIVLGNTAWGAKSVKHKSPSSVEKIRLISERNDRIISRLKDYLGITTAIIAICTTIVTAWYAIAKTSNNKSQLEKIESILNKMPQYKQAEGLQKISPDSIGVKN